MGDLTETKCTRCEELLDEEEAESPRLDKRDDNEDIICDDCYTELFEITCPICEEYFEDENFGEGKFHFIITDYDYPHSIRPGVYKAIRFPFFSSCMVGSDDIYPECVEFVAPIKHGWCKKSANGQICQECIDKLKQV